MNVLLRFEILRHFRCGFVRGERLIDRRGERVQNHEEIVEIMMKLVQSLLPNFFSKNKKKERN